LTKGTKAFWSAANPTLRFLRFLLLYCFAFCPSSLISRGHDGACPSTQKMVYVDVWKIQTTMKSTRFPIRSALVVVFFAALWLILWRQLSGEWSVNDQYSYGWFVPFFAIVLFWLRWEDRPKTQEVRGQRTEDRKKSALAIGITIVALLLLFPVRLFEIGNPDWRPLSWLHAIAVATITLALLWSIGGKPWLRHFAFPVLFALVAVPWVSPLEEPIVQGLMRVVAAIASEVVALFGILAHLEGNLIRIPGGLVGVNEACSGVRSLQTSLMIGLLFGELKRLS